MFGKARFGPFCPFRIAVMRLRYLHSRVKVQCLLHHLVSGEGHRDHRRCSQVIYGHATVKASNDAVLSIDQFQRAPHADAGNRMMKD